MRPRFPFALLSLFALALAVAACSAPASAPAANPPAPATVAEQATAAPTPTTVPAPAEAGAATTVVTTTAAVTSTTSAITPTVPAANAAPAAGDVIRLVLVQDGTQARFRVREQLAGRDLPSDAVGTTNAVTGTIAIQSDGKLVPGASKFVVDLQTLQTDQSRRDNFIKRNTLETSQYPQAVFAPTAVEGLPSPLPMSGQVKFQLTGDLTVHGVTKSVTWHATGSINGQDLTGTAISPDLKFGDFGMTQPRVAVVLSVEDKIRLEIDFHLARQ